MKKEFLMKKITMCGVMTAGKIGRVTHINQPPSKKKKFTIKSISLEGGLKAIKKVKV